MLRITYSTVDTYLTNENYHYEIINEIKKDFKKGIFNKYILEKILGFFKNLKSTDSW